MGFRPSAAYRRNVCLPRPFANGQGLIPRLPFPTACTPMSAAPDRRCLTRTAAGPCIAVLGGAHRARV